MQTLAAGLILILWGMRDYAHADGNGNHGNHGASGQQLKTGAGFHPLHVSAARRENYGVRLLFMVFWHALSGIIGLQCSIA
jgi:hypothetical protein